MATDYGKRLQLAMKNAGLNQKALIKATGMAQSSVSSAMNRGSGSADTPRLAMACGVSALWLANGEGEMLPQVVNRGSGLNVALDPVDTAQAAIKEVVDPMRSLRVILDEVPAEYRREALLDAIQAMAAWITPDTALANRARLMAEEKPSDVPRTSPKADKTRVT